MLNEASNLKLNYVPVEEIFQKYAGILSFIQIARLYILCEIPSENSYDMIYNPTMLIGIDVFCLTKIIVWRY